MPYDRPLGSLLWQSLTQPADAARTVLARSFPREALWSAVALVSILSVLSSYAMAGLTGPADPAAGNGMSLVSLSPFALALALFALLTMLVFVLHFTGRALGGTGGFDATLLTVAWTQGAFVILDVAQLLFMLLLPGLIAFASLAALLVMLRTLVHFVAVLHDFDTLGPAIGTVVLAAVGLILGFALIFGVISGTASTLGATT